MKKIIVLLFCIVSMSSLNAQDTLMFKSKGNPVIRHKFSADPSAFVYKDTLYMYATQDNTEGSFRENDPQNWLVFSSSDLTNWVEYPHPLEKETFKWATHEEQAWAAHVIERNGKFYMYATVGSNRKPSSIGVAVSDSPIGPFIDAIGKPLITRNMHSSSKKWGDVDPMVFIEDNGQAYLFWGGGVCLYARLKDNMVELDGIMTELDLPSFHTSPWIHKKDDWYYLSYGYGMPTMTAYRRSRSILGPWEDCGLINRRVENSVTNQHAIVKFKNDWLFIYHNGTLPFGGDMKRSVCIDYLFYNEDGTIKKIKMTKEGVSVSPEKLYDGLKRI